VVYKIRPISESEKKVLFTKCTQITKNPDLLLPVCKGVCKKCIFEKIKYNLQNIAKADDSKLHKLVNKGWHFYRAYATAVLLSKTEKLDFVASKKIGNSNIFYGVRGTCKHEFLIGIQYYNVPELRLLAYKDLKKYCLYSCDKLYCTSRAHKLPENFIDFLQKALHICAHEQKVLVIQFKSENKNLGLCEKCTTTNNTYLQLKNHLSESSCKDINVYYNLSYKCCDDCSICYLKLIKLNKKLVKNYCNGKITDIEFVREYKKWIYTQLARYRKLFILFGNECYGKNYDKFINIFSEIDKDEIFVLRYIFSRLEEPIIESERILKKIYANYWNKYKKEILMEVSNDENITNELLKLDAPPQNLIRLAKDKLAKSQIFAKYPKFTNLSMLGDFADKVIKCYIVEGVENAIRVVESTIYDEFKIKSLSYAFLSAFNVHKNWLFSKHEIEFGTYLKKYVEDVLNTTPENYKQKLQALLSATGSTEILTVIEQ